MTADKTQPKPIGPRFAAAIFFALFGVFFLIFAKYTLLTMENGLRLPLFPSVFLVLFTGAYVGSLFGDALAKSRTWYQALLIGFVIAIISLILLSIGMMIRAYFYGGLVFQHLQGWRDYLVLYGSLLFAMFLIVGLWLIPLTGLVSIYFSQHFLPRLIAMDSKRLQDEQQALDKTDE